MTQPFHLCYVDTNGNSRFNDWESAFNAILEIQLLYNPLADVSSKPLFYPIEAIVGYESFCEEINVENIQKLLKIASTRMIRSIPQTSLEMILMKSNDLFDMKNCQRFIHFKRFISDPKIFNQTAQKIVPNSLFTYEQQTLDFESIENWKATKIQEYLSLKLPQEHQSKPLLSRI